MEENFKNDPSQNFGDTGAAGTAARLKEQISEKAADVRDRVTDFGRRTADKMDASREPAAANLGKAASALHEQSDRVAGAVHSNADRVAGAVHANTDRVASAAHANADRVASAAHATANKLQATADYVRDHDFSEMADDVTDFVKRYPGQSLAAAAVLGFLLARVMRSGD